MTQVRVFDLDTNRDRSYNEYYISTAVKRNSELWKSVRKISGLSQQAVARKVCCSQGTITAAEGGKQGLGAYLAIDYLCCLYSHIADDAERYNELTTLLCDEDIDVLKWLVCQGDTPRMQAIRQEREKVLVNRAKLKKALEGDKNLGECYWEDCEWNEFEEDSVHTGTCPLANQ